jgi:peptidoglycan/xylan/chitin deacetylase (PgdA/CDA1 family)
VLRTHYPNFALGLPLGRNEMPIFIYHDVEADSFAADLEFLRRNRYQTLSLDEFIARSGDQSVPANAVLLTFDDARKSFHSAALPVLRDFDARATLFAPTYWMSAADPMRAPADDLFMSWDQLRDCTESGLVDVQSHAHRHALVCVAERVVGFATPELLSRYDIYDWPMRHTGSGDQLGRPALGTPIYEAAPLLSAAGRFLESEAAARACCACVERGGGANFFAQPDWLKQLRGAHDAALADQPGRFLTASQFQALVASEFEQSRDQFRRHLGYAPSSLAYPWMLGSRLSLDLAARFDITNVFGVALDYGHARNAQLPVRVFGRLKADWLPTLPGKGRSNLASVARRKLSGFTKTMHLAH